MLLFWESVIVFSGQLRLRTAARLTRQRFTLRDCELDYARFGRKPADLAEVLLGQFEVEVAALQGLKRPQNDSKRNAGCESCAYEVHGIITETAGPLKRRAKNTVQEHP